MANPEHVEVVTRGAELVKQWRKANPETILNLRRSKFTFAKLYAIDLTEADLRGADFSGSDLSGADFSLANLGATDLSGANLRWATLTATDLTSAKLRDTDLTHAILGETNLIDLDLVPANGLEFVFHQAPSNLSTSTLVQSKGRIPNKFLKGCGLADWEIHTSSLYDPDLTSDEVQEINVQIGTSRLGKPIQTKPVFVSYTHADELPVEKIEAALDATGIRVWRDVHDVVAGPLEKQVHRAMEGRVVLIVLSDKALDSDWVRAEVEHARTLEKQQKRHVLCPIALDDSWSRPREPHWPERLMVQVKDYAVLDFSRWQDDRAFAETFRKLEAGIRKWY